MAFVVIIHFALLCALLLWACITDVKSGVINRAASVGVAAVGVCLVALGVVLPVNALVGGGVTLFIMLLTSFIVEAILRRKYTREGAPQEKIDGVCGFGGGDIWLLSACGVAVGFTGILFAVVIGAVASVIYRLFKKGGRGARVKYAPFIAIGVVPTFFVMYVLPRIS